LGGEHAGGLYRPSKKKERQQSFHQPFDFSPGQIQSFASPHPAQAIQNTIFSSLLISLQAKSNRAIKKKNTIFSSPLISLQANPTVLSLYKQDCSISWFDPTSTTLLAQKKTKPAVYEVACRNEVDCRSTSS
jgi:hypothetical protein